MNRRGWMADVQSATTRGRCTFYVGDPDRDTQRLCRRTGTYALTVGNGIPQGPLCWQHALRMQDRATARAIDTGQTVRLTKIEEVAR